MNLLPKVYRERGTRSAIISQAKQPKDEQGSTHLVCDRDRGVGLTFTPISTGSATVGSV